MAIKKKPARKKPAAKKTVKKAASAKSAKSAKAKPAKKKTAKKAVTKKAAAKKSALKKSARKAAKPSLEKSTTRKSRAPAPRKAAKPAGLSTRAGMKKAARLLSESQSRQDDLYGGGPSFRAAEGHPTRESEMTAQKAHANPKMDDRQHIEQLGWKNIQGHIAAQTRANQGRRDNR